MPLLRSNLTCFYCGTKSNLKKDGRIRHFQCKECEAVNYLDENGQITDPPASEAGEPVRYAHSVPVRSASPILNLQPSDRNLFCATCIKNQHLLTQTLAAYLPPPSDPSYDAYEKSYPEYRRNLERRYPQVCVNCAPRVEERIRAAGYAAKTDHLRRLMDRTKRAGFMVKRTGIPWQSWVIFWAGIAWNLSVALHLLWSLMGAMVNFREWEPEERTTKQDWYTCGGQARKFGEVEPICVSTWNYPEMKYALGMALLSCWWNSKLRAKLNGAIGRLKGLGDHMRLQVLVLLVRGISWWFLKEPETTKLSNGAYRAAHMFMMLFLLVTSIISWTIVQIDRNPRISFTDKPKPLLEDTIEDAPRPLGFYNNPAPQQNFNAQSPSYIKPFPINNLAQPLHMQSPPSPSPSFTTTYTAVTTAATTRPYDPRYDDEDTMEWTPTKQTQTSFFDLKPRRQPTLAQQQATALLNSTATGAERSPFYGTLPPAPIAPAHKLRNPPNQPTFKKTSLVKQKDFFSKLMAPRGTNSNNRNNTDYDDDDATSIATTAVRPRGEIPLADPKLRLREDPVDTGLEAMFSSVFSIRDEPAEVRARSGSGSGGNGYGGAYGSGFGSGFGVGNRGDNEEERRRAEENRRQEAEVKWVLVILTLPFACVGVAWAVQGVRSWVGL